MMFNANWNMATLNRKTSVYPIVMILLVLCSLSLARVSSPETMNTNTVYVDGNNTGSQDGTLGHPYNTIQKGINAASVGGVVQVASGTYYENVVINKSLTLKGAGSDITIIDGSGKETGVKITADNVTVSGFTIRNSLDGVFLDSCNGVTISDNTITSNGNDGVWLKASDNNVVSDNTITLNNLGGILLGHSSGNTISGNAISDNDYGIDLFEGSNGNIISGNTITSHINQAAISLEDSSGNTISNNTFLSNKLGIDLFSSSDNSIINNTILGSKIDGIVLSNSVGNAITNNLIAFNNWTGIAVSESSNNNIIGNTISENEHMGIEIYSSNNKLYHNNFINNKESQVKSYFGATNTWDDSYPSGGNYWSNYTETDANGDGIGDIPYEIDATNQDSYPLMNPYDKMNPVADASSDQLVVKDAIVTFDGSGSTDNIGIKSYEWNFGDGNVTTVDYPVMTHRFTVVGNYLVTLNVSDYSDNWDIDEIWVNVTETQIIRDVAIANITVAPTTVTTGDTISIDVAAANKGEFSEDFRVTVYYNFSVVGAKNVTSLVSGGNETLGFNWDTTGVPGGDYTIRAVASIVAGETNTTDNTLTYDTIITIEKLVSTISVSVFPANIIVGESVTINGSISPVRVKVNVTIHYTKLSGEAWGTLTTVTTDVEGRYSYDWTPTMAGTYEVKASWEGNLTHLPDESEVVVVIVNMASSIVSISVSPDSVAVGSNITISGAISPVQVGVSVTIQYRFSGGSWVTLATVATDSEGNYSYDWTATEPGDYEVKASWGGDDNILASESDVWTVVVKEPATNVYLYAAMAIAVGIVVSAMIVYVVRIRKPKPA